MRANDRVLYEGSSKRSGVSICVTMNWCVSDGVHYPVAALGDLGKRRGERDPFHPPAIAGLVLVLAVLALVVVAIGRRWTADVGAAIGAAVLGTAAVTFLPSALAGVLRRPYEIWAEYEGRPVCLFATFDREQFGQVSRALLRARESLDQL
jgi:hypothetical protein